MEKKDPETIEEILKAMWFRLRRFEAKLTFLCDRQCEMSKKMDTITERIEALGKSCANGFYQTRDAAECLRSELSSSTGTLISATDNDWKDLNILRV